MLSLMAMLGFVSLGLQNAAAHPPFQLDARAQLRTGLGQMVGASGPSSFQTADLILTPGVQATGIFQRSYLLARYAPQILMPLSMRSLTRSLTKPLVLHRLNMLYSTAENPQAWHVASGVYLNVGQLDFTHPTALIDDFAGTLGPGSTHQMIRYFGLTGFVKSQMPVGRHGSWVSRVTAGKMDTPTLGPAASVGTPSAETLTLQQQRRASFQNDFIYQTDEQHRWQGSLLMSFVDFPSTTTYLGVAPSLAWDNVLGRLTQMKVKLGLMQYWSRPQAGGYEGPSHLIIAAAALERTFSDWGFPRLHGRISLEEGPYYDMLIGKLVPRGTAGVESSYDLTRHIKTSGAIRWFTAAYYDGRHWMNIDPGRDKNIGIVDVRVKYTYSNLVAFESGAMVLKRWSIPTALYPWTGRQEIYFFVGAMSTYPIY